MHFIFVVFLTTLSFTLGIAAPAEAQSTGLCRTEVDFRYAESSYSSDLGGYRKFLPSMELNQLVATGFAWQAIKRPSFEDQRQRLTGTDTLEACGSSDAEVVSGVYALSFLETGPWLIGEACTERPRVGLMVSGRQVSEIARSAVTQAPMDREMMTSLVSQADLARRDANAWHAMPNKYGKFEAMSFAIFNLLAQQCGAWPTSVEFIAHLGLTGRMLFTAPQVARIRADLSGGEYRFSFENLSPFQDFADQAAQAEMRHWTAASAALRERESRIAEWQNREGRFALGLLIVAGALAGIAETSLCNDNDPSNDPAMAVCQ